MDMVAVAKHSELHHPRGISQETRLHFSQPVRERKPVAVHAHVDIKEVESLAVMQTQVLLMTVMQNIPAYLSMIRALNAHE